MAWLGDCIRSAWPLSYCLLHSELDEDWPPLKPVDEKPNFFVQHPLIPPPKIDFGISRPLTRDASQSSRWKSDNRNGHSRASSITSHATRKSKSRRPTIGAPVDFRRVDAPMSRREAPFRPLELSIYAPGNELPPLPIFSKDGMKVPPKATITAPAPAHTVITQKSLGSLEHHVRDDSIYSYDDTSSLSPSILSRAHSIYNDAVTALPQSTRGFLELLDEGPRPPVPLKIKSRNGSQPLHPVRRNASDQNMRLRAHIEERQEMESRMHDYDTILEDSHSPALNQPRAASRAESTIQSTMERALTNRNNVNFSRSAPNLPYTVRPLPKVPTPTVPPLPRPLALPVSHFNAAYVKSTHPAFPAPCSPPRHVPPPIPTAPKAQLFRGPQWYHPQPAVEDYASATDPFRHQHEYKPSVSSMSSGDCPSLGSAWSTPRSSLQRADNALYSLRAKLPEDGIGRGAGKYAVEGGFGVAF